MKRYRVEQITDDTGASPFSAINQVRTGNGSGFPEPEMLPVYLVGDQKAKLVKLNSDEEHSHLWSATKQSANYLN